MNEDLKEDLGKAVECLKKGGIILYPTDTIWGLGCDATSSEAVKKIFKIKKREDSKAMLTLVHNEAALERIADEIPDVAWELLDAATEPLTVIYDNARGVAPVLIAEDGSLGVRITKEPFSAELCRRFGRPIVSTSANISGEKAPRNFAEITDEIKKQADYIVKTGQDDTTQKAPSHIIKLSKGGVIKIIR